MNYQDARLEFGRRLQTRRLQRGLTQEQFAEALDKSTEHISFLERGERSPSFEMLLDLARVLETSLVSLLDDAGDTAYRVENALAVAPISSPLPEPAQETPRAEARQLSDLERLYAALNGVNEMQTLANEYGISDIFQDNGGKVLQVLILLGLQISPGREGNDAVDTDGNEYELKTVNRALNKNAGITTHHHLNRDILRKYRAVKAWYIASYEGVELREIYRLTPSLLEPLFQQWEDKIVRTGSALNNPKIPVRFVREGERVYPPSTDGVSESRSAS